MGNKANKTNEACNIQGSIINKDQKTHIEKKVLENVDKLNNKTRLLYGHEFIISCSVFMSKETIVYNNRGTAELRFINILNIWLYRLNLEVNLDLIGTLLKDIDRTGDPADTFYVSVIRDKRIKGVDAVFSDMSENDIKNKPQCNIVLKSSRITSSNGETVNTGWFRKELWSGEQDVQYNEIDKNFMIFNSHGLEPSVDDFYLINRYLDTLAFGAFKDKMYMIELGLVINLKKDDKVEAENIELSYRILKESLTNIIHIDDYGSKILNTMELWVGGSNDIFYEYRDDMETDIVNDDIDGDHTRLELKSLPDWINKCNTNYMEEHEITCNYMICESKGKVFRNPEYELILNLNDKIRLVTNKFDVITGNVKDNNTDDEKCDIGKSKIYTNEVDSNYRSLMKQRIMYERDAIKNIVSQLHKMIKYLDNDNSSKTLHLMVDYIANESFLNNHIKLFEQNNWEKWDSDRGKNGFMYCIKYLNECIEDLKVNLDYVEGVAHSELVNLGHLDCAETNSSNPDIKRLKTVEKIIDKIEQVREKIKKSNERINNKIPFIYIECLSKYLMLDCKE